MLKRIVLSALCLYLAVIGSTSTFASTMNNDKMESKELIMPYMNYTSDAYCLISNKQKGVARIDCVVNGYSGITTKIEVSVYLEEYSNGAWQRIKTYTQTSNSHTLSMYKESAVTIGRSYRVSALVRAYSGERSEIHIIRSKEVRF